MRSIDWSSDVFSSDLASVRLHHRPAPRHYAFLLKVQTDGQIYLPRGPVIGGENAFGTQGRAKARRSVGEDEFARIGILPQEVVARDDIFRSEEHTSELQSLMRISYAVFCLKKKTKRTYQTRNSLQHIYKYQLDHCS